MKTNGITKLANQIIALRSAPSPIPAPLTYKSGGHTSAMIALFLPTSVGAHFMQSDPGALPPSELHITLAYLGKVADLSDRQILETRDLMRLISENHPPVTGHINGCGRFCNGDDDGDPFFIIPDLAALPNLRQVIIDGLGSHSIEGAKDHGFIPHITLTYLPHAENNPFDIIEKTPISFQNISLVLGDDRYDYPLAQGVPLLSSKALIEKIGARHTGAERGTIQKMHDLTLDLGAECNPLTRRAGAKHSHADRGLVQRMHDDCAGLGAECNAVTERDPVYSSQTLKGMEIVKGSAGSGNFGHDGRPGRLGGSQGGGGLRRIGAKKDSKPGARKKAAKKFGDKRKQDKKTKAKKGLPDTRIKPGEAKKKSAKTPKGKKRPNSITSDTAKRRSIGDPDTRKKAKSMNNSDLTTSFDKSKTHAERVAIAEEAFSRGGDNRKIARFEDDIPTVKKKKLTQEDTITKGHPAIIRLKDGSIGLGIVARDVNGDFMAAATGGITQEVTPVFKAALTIRAQSDAPNYQPASTPQRCANCRFFLGDPGRDWCDLFDFTADQDFVCDAWETQRPDEIPGYVANKGGLTEKDWENSTLSQRSGRDAVNNAIKAGMLKKASTKTCYRCGKRPGAEYHHIDGYSKKKKLNVRAICHHCHATITEKAEANKADLAALTKGILILRGSAGSGNFGHTGRPGKLGGSAGGGGLKRIGAKKKSSPAARKKAAKKFRTKQTTKPKAQAKPKVQVKPTATKKPAAKPKPQPAAKPVAAKKPAAKPTPAEKPAAKKRVTKEDKVSKVDKTAGGDVRDAKATNNKIMSKNSEAWQKTLSAAELEGLQDYQGSEFGNINGSLRGQEKATADNKKAIRNMDKALKKSPLKEDTVVFRSMDEGTLEKLLGPDMKKWTGQSYGDKGYSSTSIDPKGTFGIRGIPMEIRVPKGTPAGYMANLPGGGVISAGEQELLLGRGQKFRILKVKGGRNPKIIAEVIN